jgi:hypothetical protein
MVDKHKSLLIRNGVSCSKHFLKNQGLLWFITYTDAII